jgi:two-component sensor histidine kinase
VYDPSKTIEVALESEPIKLNVNQAIPCALIINEIVTNAYKHAFDGQESGSITIQVYEKDEQIHVKIHDNGVGIPEDMNLDQSSSLGITLINLLQQQLEADLEFKRKDGTTIYLTFSKANVGGIGSNLEE